MNERIKELAEQAMSDVREEAYPEERSWGMDDVMEKFAELLIKECINQCNKNDPRPDAYSDWEEFAESRKVRECITSIKKHFGVE